MEAIFSQGVQVGWAVWEESPSAEVVFCHDAWERPVGVVFFQEHDNHSFTYGWLRDFESVARVKRPGDRRMYMKSVYCSDCDITLASIWREQGSAGKWVRS